MVDVIAPAEPVDGGWPVLVTFHGAAAGTSAVDMSAVASAGAVVVGPRWIDPSWDESNLAVLSASDYVEGAYFDVATCALGAAQDVAAAHGGDPGRTTVEGFSAGAHAAAWVGLGVARADPCPEQEVVAPVAMVVGDGQWVFEGFAGEWDAAFAGGSSTAADTVDRFLGADRWAVPDGFVAYLWSSESTDVDRDVENPPADDSWIRARGGEDLVDDLDAVGAFDDGSIGFLDNGLLMELRMQDAGLSVLHEQLAGGHSRKPEMVERTISVLWGEPPGA
ncbi:hypothetical protein OEB99_05160 [Actinotalea sp. M2MS4P-6]|uniref:hypothetical protein n=1 Tax=Actinotalea sp. M2MS4P-6 TaxID=2983762 RepID=UPI0021E476B0|nr:hypothetical protein [Actinotalea sp. M2MS4P-6]MCV2393691.1 hypothetical protein [Actinotalea sp. M2MS4P-6]